MDHIYKFFLPAILFTCGHSIQTEMTMSPTNNVTTLVVGNNQRFVCTISPCVGILHGHAVVTFGGENKLFIGCDEPDTRPSGKHFFCRSDICSFGVDVFNISRTHDETAVGCLYRSGGGMVLKETRYIRVFEKPKERPIIWPRGPFSFMEEVTLTCTSDEGYPEPSITFTCGYGDGRIYSSNNGSTSSSLHVTMDSRMAGVKCRCTVDQELTGYHEETSLDIIILSDNITSISPIGPFTDGQNITFTCCIDQDGITNSSVTLSCHGKEETQTLSNLECLTLPAVFADRAYNNTKCACSALSDDRSVDVLSDTQLIITSYISDIQLPRAHQVLFGNEVVLTCAGEDLEYPFTFGKWEVPEMIGQYTTNITRTETILTVTDSNYGDMGAYGCTVIDQREAGRVVSISSTKLDVNGPVFLENAEINSRNDSECVLNMVFKSNPAPVVKSVWEDNKKVNIGTPNTTLLGIIRHGFQLRFDSSPSQKTYGVVVSNDGGQTDAVFYFDRKGRIFDRYPMLKSSENISDGLPATITCFDVTETDASVLHLDCNNKKELSITEDNVAATKIHDFVADIDDNGTNCSCSSSRSNSSSTITISIKPYLPKNISRGLVSCESTSRATLRCRDESLPNPFTFGSWVHYLNGVVIRELPGTKTRDATSLDVQFCTFEDIGNYSCTILDTRKNKIIFNSTMYLDVPGPPVIVDTSMKSGQDCLMEVKFYSFNDSKLTIKWYKNGKSIYSTEHMKQSLSTFVHHVLMHNTSVPINGRSASLKINKDCDIENSIYRIEIENEGASVSHTFEKEDRSVKVILIVSLTIATVVFFAGIMIIICKNAKGAMNCCCSCDERVYNTINIRQTRSSQFYQEIDMVIESLRQADEDETRKHETDSIYETIIDK